jgi:hypothetical protein
MGLGDVISNMDLTIYAKVPLVIFLGVFVAICLRVLGSPGSRYEACAQIPLDDDTTESDR